MRAAEAGYHWSVKRLRLRYGTDILEVATEAPDVTVIEPRFVDGAARRRRPRSARRSRQPIGGPPLRELVGARDRVAVVIPDITRPLPTDRLLPWLFAELPHVPRRERHHHQRHRLAPREHAGRAARDGRARRCRRRYRVVNHDAHDASTLAPAGQSRDGRPVSLTRDYVEADRRIVLGFIEPHFMAGFSGGYKGVFPALADIDSIMHYHRAAVIGDPKSTWGVLDGNPTQDADP